jgi:hypothetical protein
MLEVVVMFGRETQSIQRDKIILNVWEGKF